MARFIAIVFIVCLFALTGCSSFAHSSTQTISTDTSDVNSATLKSANGLSLSLSLDSTTYQPGQQVDIVIDEKNTLGITNKLNASEKWPVRGIRVGPCGTLNYPFGVAIFQGNYTVANVSSATPLQIYEPGIYHCPMILAGIFSYGFQPLSDTAAIFQMPESDAAFTLEMKTEFEPAPTGYWTGNVQNTTLTDFEPGVYTVVAGDEWGALVVLHFTVS
jgi:hypothetical protein